MTPAAGERTRMTPLKDWLHKLQNAEPQDPAALEARVVEVLRGIYDPELPVNIYDLGLIYGIDCGPDGVPVSDRHVLVTDSPWLLQPQEA